MPGWLKVLLIILLVGILLVVGVIAAAGIWFYRNKEVLQSKINDITTEARDFGKNTDNQGCVNETISRYKADSGLTSAISNSIFMRLCLDASRPTAGFCDDVPKQTEFMKAAQWRNDQCQRFGLERDTHCHGLFKIVQQFCEEKSGGDRVSTASVVSVPRALATGSRLNCDGCGILCDSLRLCILA